MTTQYSPEDGADNFLPILKHCNIKTLMIKRLTHSKIDCIKLMTNLTDLSIDLGNELKEFIHMLKLMRNTIERLTITNK